MELSLDLWARVDMLSMVDVVCGETQRVVIGYVCFVALDVVVLGD